MYFIGGVIMIKIKLLNEYAKMPFKPHVGDVGLDLFSAENIIIPPCSRALVGTGVAIALPESNLDGYGYYIRIAPRSGLAVKSGINVFAGVIDSMYRGEIKVCLYNSTDESFSVTIGDRIAQMIPTVFLACDLEEVDVLPKSTSRFDAGFGSSGMR